MNVTYDYAAIRVNELVPVILAITPGSESQGYLSDDQSTRRYNLLISLGYRWVRTEDGVAIFERQRDQP